MLIDTSMAMIRAYASAEGLSAEKFGKLADVPPSTARDVLKGRGNPTSDTIRKMEAAIPQPFRDAWLVNASASEAA